MKTGKSRVVIPLIIIIVVMCACSAMGGFWWMNRGTSESIDEVETEEEGSCIGEGLTIRLDDEVEDSCCSGLSPVPFTHPVADEPSGCSFQTEDVYDPNGLNVCLNCGDGICGAGENYCICPTDCER